MTSVADGVLVYASDPTPTGGELVYDFAAGQIRFVLAAPATGTDASATTAAAAGTAVEPTATTTTTVGAAGSAGSGHNPAIEVKATAGIGAGIGAASPVSVPAATVGFASTQNGTITYATDPAVTGTELVFDFIAGAVGFVAAHDNAARTTVTTGAATAQSVAWDAQISVLAAAESASGVGAADAVGTGFEPGTATAVGVAYDVGGGVTADAHIAVAGGAGYDTETAVYVNAVEAVAAAGNNDASVLSSVVGDIDPLTINVRTRGSTVTIYRNYRS